MITANFDIWIEPDVPFSASWTFTGVTENGRDMLACVWEHDGMVGAFNGVSLRVASSEADYMEACAP